MSNNELNITINGKSIQQFYSSITGAEFIALLGHAYYSCQRRGGESMYFLDTSKEDLEQLIGHLDSLESWLIGSIDCLGDFIYAVDKDDLDDDSLQKIGFLLSGLSDFLSFTQEATSRFNECRPVPAENNRTEKTNSSGEDND